MLIIFIKTTILSSMDCVHIYKQNTGFSSKSYSVNVKNWQWPTVSRQLLMVCFCICMEEFVLFIWVSFYGIFLFVVKIVVTSLWAKAKGLFGCLILLAWLVVVFFEKKKKMHINKTNPIPQKYSAEMKIIMKFSHTYNSWLWAPSYCLNPKNISSLAYKNTSLKFWFTKQRRDCLNLPHLHHDIVDWNVCYHEDKPQNNLPLNWILSHQVKF